MTGGPATPVDVRTECEELRAENEYLRDIANNASAMWRATRASVVAMIAVMCHWGEGDLFDQLDGTVQDAFSTRWTAVEETLSITEDELKADYQRQYDEWVRESTDGQ